MINQGHIRIRRISIDRFTLLIVVVEERIVIIDGNDCGFTFYIARFSLVFLHPLKVIVLIQSVSIDVVVVGCVLIDVVVPAVELVINKSVA